jgi:Membrane protein involved in the export of O-antigen and teichoic acid
MNSIIKNYIYNTGYQLLTILIPIITTPYIARVIGSSGMGKYTYENSIAYYFVMFIMLGLNNYGNRTIARVRDDKEAMSKNFCEIYLMQMIIGIVVTILYFIFCIISAKNNSLRWIMIIYVFSAVVDINWFFFGLEKFQLIVLRNTIIKIITTICIFTFIREKKDLYLYVIILLSGTFISNLMLWIIVFNNIILIKVRFSNVIQHLKNNLLLFIPIVAVSLYKYMDKIMLGILSEIKQVGFYEYSEKIIQIPMALVNSLGTIMLPKMSNLVVNNRNKDEERYISNSILFAGFSSSSLCFGLMGIAKEFVPFFYGNGYSICVYLFYILLPSCCFIAFANVIRTQYLIPHRMDIIYIKSVILGAIVNFIFNIILILHFQAIGAAIATLMAEILVCLYQAVKLKDILNISQYVKDTIPFITAGIIMLIVLIKIPTLEENLFITIIIKIIVGSITYLTVLRINLQLRKEELKKIRIILSKVK